ncbi:MAG: flagellar basal body rod protein FlgC [Defluviitaleaceae bacterium]|nr:flagellar basal body rod protein FlgC [Defluviitaleaceae bacterium]
MAFFDAFNISATGLSAQRLRMDVISQNMANVNTTRTEDGTPYKRKVAIFQEVTGTASPFSYYLNSASGYAGSASDNFSGGVRVSDIVNDETPGNKVYDTGHPDADADGYVTMPNVSTVTEMVNMISASRAYEANVTAMNNTKAMIAKTLEISR